jgi:hypothetical protein
VRVSAYLLAADPTWIEASVRAYYDRVEEIVVSYDRDGIGWAGSPIATEESLAALRALDVEAKMRFVAGDFHHLPTPPENEHLQRQGALEALTGRADWVLQVDTDEVLPDLDVVFESLRYAEDHNLPAVEWPMRVLFRHVRDDVYLAVTSHDGSLHVEYPGPIGIRPGATLVDARRCEGPFLRVVVGGAAPALQLSRAPAAGEDRSFTITEGQAILHNSWARSPSVVRRKIRAWGHYEGWRTRRYYLTTWLPSPWLWRWQRDLHPFSRGLWPRLSKVRVPDPVGPQTKRLA